MRDVGWGDVDQKIQQRYSNWWDTAAVRVASAQARYVGSRD